MRERYMRHGLGSFEDHEVLEVLLYYAIARRDTNELAHRLLSEFGSLDLLFDADPMDTVKIAGMTDRAAVLVSMVPALSGRYQNSRYSKKSELNSSDKIGEFAVSLFAGKSYECFHIICLDNRKQLIAAPMVSEGTVNEAPVYPRRAAKEALKYNAVSVVLAHNHPSGELTPSESDRDVTGQIASALSPLEIDVLDHVIIGNGRYYSFAEHGLML